MKLTYTEKNIGKAICYIRLSKNIKQEFIASKAGITKEAISKIENGHCNINITRINQLLKILETRPDDFWNSFYYPPPETNHTK